MRLPFSHVDFADDLQIVGFDQDLSPVRFCAQCNVHQLYLVLSDVDGSSRAVHQMSQGGPDRWSIDLELKPGAYRYRYYAVQGLLLPEDGPASPDDILVIIESADQTIRVRGQTKCVNHPDFVQAWIVDKTDDAIESSPPVTGGLLAVGERDLHC